MALDKLVDSTKLDACLDAEADAIRAKTGGSTDLTFDFANNKGFADAIDSIQTGGGTDLTPFFAVVGEVTPTADSTSLAFPTDGEFASVDDVLFFFACVDDYTQFISQNNMIVGSYKSNTRRKIPTGVVLERTIKTIDTSKNPPLNYWRSGTDEAINGNNYVISNSGPYYFKAGVKYNYILLGVGV